MGSNSKVFGNRSKESTKLSLERRNTACDRTTRPIPSILYMLVAVLADAKPSRSSFDVRVMNMIDRRHIQSHSPRQPIRTYKYSSRLAAPSAAVCELRPPVLFTTRPAAAMAVIFSSE